MVTLLAEDYPLTWDDVIHHVAPGATLGRPHIADALVAAGVVEDRSEAFSSILTSHSRYYIQHYAPDPALAVELVRAAGGVPVFAHPVASARGRIVGEKTYREMIDAGLAGLEIDHRDNPEEGREFLRRLAKTPWPARDGLLRLPRRREAEPAGRKPHLRRRSWPGSRSWAPEPPSCAEEPGRPVTRAPNWLRRCPVAAGIPRATGHCNLAGQLPAGTR